MPSLVELHDVYGQSPWLDNLRRSWISGGELSEWVRRGVRGVTSNPAIFQKAISTDTSYDDQLAELLNRGTSVSDAYWTMVVDDIVAACDILAPVYDASDRSDGFVSVEVSPALANDTAATIEAARELADRIARPNLMVKIPATSAGLPAVTEVIARGVNVNVTLIFGLERYGEVIEAYLSGLERSEGDLSGTASVASFFVSRVDTEIDHRLEALGTAEASHLRGTAALAQARVAYSMFVETFSGERWDPLKARGAQFQRPLWASTSTKNRDYPDTMYVDGLIAPHTVNTLPDPTLEAFCEHGTARRTIDDDGLAARSDLERLETVGIDLAEVSLKLEHEGVSAFVKSYDELLATLSLKADSV